jgi:hypothetical protein
MDASVVGMVILVIVLLYILYVYFVKKSSTLTKSANLNSANPDITALNSGQSTRYAYCIWVFINTWNASATANPVIFQRTNNIKLYMDKTKPTLFCQITQDPAGNSKDIMITDNFPIQAWTCVAISADNQIIDCYIDGKLVNSSKLPNAPKTPTDSATAPVKLGTGWDCYVAGFQNWSGPIGPQEAWNTYIQGNGSALSQYFASYGITLSVSKNNVEQSKYTLL